MTESTAVFEDLDDDDRWKAEAALYARCLLPLDEGGCVFRRSI